VFLKEVARNLGLSERVEVLTARFEELALDPVLSEAFSLLTVRAVRIGAPEIAKLAAFLGHGGQMCLFHGPETSVSGSIPGLSLQESVPMASLDRSIVTLLTGRSQMFHVEQSSRT